MERRLARKAEARMERRVARKAGARRRVVRTQVRTRPIKPRNQSGRKRKKPISCCLFSCLVEERMLIKMSPVMKTRQARTKRRKHITICSTSRTCRTRHSISADRVRFAVVRNVRSKCRRAHVSRDTTWRVCWDGTRQGLSASDRFHTGFRPVPCRTATVHVTLLPHTQSMSYCVLSDMHSRVGSAESPAGLPQCHFTDAQVLTE